MLIPSLLSMRNNSKKYYNENGFVYLDTGRLSLYIEDIKGIITKAYFKEIKIPVNFRSKKHHFISL